MLLSHVTSDALIFLDQPWSSREIILENLCQRLFDAGKSRIKPLFYRRCGTGKAFLKPDLSRASPFPTENPPPFYSLLLPSPV